MWLHGGRFCPCSQEHPVRFSPQQSQLRIGESHLPISETDRIQIVWQSLIILNQTKIWSTVLSGFCSSLWWAIVFANLHAFILAKSNLSRLLHIYPSDSTPLWLSPSDSDPSASTPPTRPPFILPLRLRPLASPPPPPPPQSRPPLPPPSHLPSDSAPSLLPLHHRSDGNASISWPRPLIKVYKKGEDSLWVRKQICWPLWPGLPWPLPGQSSPKQKYKSF